MKQKQKAFTLIELLVVAGIIAVLATVIVVGYSNAKKKSRDARRASDAGSILTAMDLFYEDNGSYQLTGYGNASSGNEYFNQVYSGTTISMAQYLVNSKYLSSLVQDPLSSQDYMIYQMSSGKMLGVYAKFEQTSDIGGNACDVNVDPNKTSLYCGGTYSMNYVVIRNR